MQRRSLTISMNEFEQSRITAERQRRLYDTILSNTPDLVYVFDLDHRFVYANAVLLRMWGKTWDEAIGKNCLELGYPDWHAAMHDREIEQVIATKAPIRGEVPFAGTFGRRIYDYIFVPVLDADGEVEAIAGTTRDVTERQAVERRNHFLVTLDDALRPLADPREITLTAVRVLGTHLEVDRCAYADIEEDQDTMNLEGNYIRHEGIGSMVGRLKFADFGPEVLQLMRENKPYVVHDLDSHEPSVSNKESYRAAQIQAVICVPLHKAGRFVAAMAVHMATPRVWTPEEVELLLAVAARCWESIERAKLERGLVETERRFRSMADAAPVLIWVSDETRATTWLNKAWIDFTGRPLDRLSGMGWTEGVHPDDLLRCLEIYSQKFDAREPFAMDCRLRRQDGEYRWVLSQGLPRFEAGGRFAGYVCSSVDITERRLAEEKLRESEERFRAFVTTSSDVVYRMIPDWREMRQLQVRNFMGDPSQPSSDWLQKFIHPEDWALVKSAVSEAIRTRSEFKLEHRFIREDGSMGWTYSRAIPLMDARGKVIEWFGTAMDVTDRRLAEQALRESEERARAASVAKDNFLAQLSHELRTPLTPVLMTAAALKEDDTLPEHTRDVFGMIERNIALEARLIDDLLDLTRVTRGKLALRTETCDVHALLRQAVEIIRDEVNERQVEVVLQLGAHRPMLTGDPARLQQVFWNLLRNAVKFTPRGGHITVRTVDGTLGPTQETSPAVGVEIVDDGIGFPPEEAEQLFQPFHQGSHGKSTGLGLGLAIARAIVELHHGRITGSSTGPGQGAVFSVLLPVRETVLAEPGGPSPVSNRADATAPANPDRPLHLLVVEDHEPTLRVLSLFLRKTGHSVVTAGSLAEARSLAREQRFDAVISDLGLPDGTGVELMTELRALHGLTGIALSGYGMEEDLRRTREAGFYAHLVKPVKFDELRMALRRLDAAALRQPA